MEDGSGGESEEERRDEEVSRDSVDAEDSVRDDFIYKDVSDTEGSNELSPQSRLLQLTMKCKFKEANQLISEMGKSIGELEKDKHQRTAAHYAAGHSRGESTLQLLVETAGSECLLMGDEDDDDDYYFLDGNCTPMHLSAHYHSKKQFDSNLSHCSKESLQMRTRNGNTCVHYLAANQKHGDEIMLSMAQKEPECLSWQNAAQQTVLHWAALHLSAETVKKLMQIAGPDCIAMRDDEGNTMLHYAASNEEGAPAILAAVNIVGPQCLSWQNKQNETALNFAAANFSAETVKKLMQIAGPDCIAMGNSKGNTMLHDAARHEERGPAILAAVDIVGPQCLSWRNKQKKTVLHIAAAYCSAETVKQLMQIAGPDCIAMRDDKGDTIAHFAARNWKYGDVLLHVVQMGPQCLSWTNNKHVTVLHQVLECQRIEVVTKLVHIAGPDCIAMRDEEGNSCAHYAASNEDDDVIQFALETLGPECLGWVNTAKQSVLHVAVGHHKGLLSDVKSLLNQVVDKTIVTKVDIDLNTLLHALFTKLTSFDLQAALHLVHAGADPLAENNLGQNCFHATTIYSFILRDVLKEAVLTDETRQLFQRLLLASNGLHAVHAFSGRQDLSDLSDSLAKLSDMSVSDLLHLTVPNEPHKGATCLHFACEAGHEENIEYLMNNNLKLSAETDAGLSCIDFAQEKGKLNEVLDALKNVKSKPSQTDLWRLLDPPKRALRLQDRSNAQQLLASISDESMTAEVHRDKRVQRAGDDPGGSKEAGTERNISERDTSRADLKILLRAVQLDSLGIFRGAISLNLITTETERLFPAFLKRMLESKASGIEGNFPGKDEFLQSQLIDSTSELSIIDTVAFFDKTEVLSGLMLTRQFDLIPACISLLIRLKPRVSQMKGKHEQLKQLNRKVTSIAVNALDELYFNANDDEKILLFKYINGKFKETTGSHLGPKFPCRPAVGSAHDSTVKYCTVMKMVEDAADGDLFATDCLHRLVENEWHPEMDIITPRVKFYINLTAFIIFLVFFAWYITDFQRMFQFWPPDLVLSLYSVSFTFQEIADFRKKSKLRSFYCCKMVCRLPLYFKDVLNIFDCSALLFMWIGLLWKLAMWGCLPDILLANPEVLKCDVTNATNSQSLANPASTNEPQVSQANKYACQMILSTSFLLWGFRSVSFLSYSERIGPVISMLKSLLIKDLVPFFVIILVIFYSFGVFFFNLLFPVITSVSSERDSSDYGWNVFLQVFTLPFNLLFTNFDKIGFETASNGTDQSVGHVANPGGFGWFNNLLLFVFLVLANIVMLNLLIARFNLRISRMDSKALGIWRRTYFEMLREYQSISPLPPPLSFLYYLFSLCQCCHERRQQARIQNGNVKNWWLNESNCPKEYNQFLRFQATRFRRIRPQLSREVTRNKTDTEALKAHTEMMSAANRDMQESLHRLEKQLARLDESQSKNSQKLQSVEKSLTDGLIQNQEKKSDADGQQTGEFLQGQKEGKSEDSPGVEEKLNILEQKLQSIQDTADKRQHNLEQKLQSIQDTAEKTQQNLEQNLEQKLQSIQDTAGESAQKADYRMKRQRKRLKELGDKLMELGDKVDKVMELGDKVDKMMELGDKLMDLLQERH